jgi:hypothetical protein
VPSSIEQGNPDVRRRRALRILGLPLVAVLGASQDQSAAGLAQAGGSEIVVSQSGELENPAKRRQVFSRRTRGGL